MTDTDNTHGYEYGRWTQIRASVKTPALDRLTAIMSVIDENLMIEDYSDFDLHGMYGELADESLLNADRTVASVSVFIPEDGDAEGALSFLRGQLAAEGIEAVVTDGTVNEEDWINNWKKFYRPLRIGRHIVIVPKWEKFEPLPGDVTVTMDPGMAFGTGSHETTRGIIGMLEESVRPGDSVLDIGTGSGILGIVAMKLGASLCRAYDIDPIAAEVAKDNFAVNGLGPGGTGDVACGVSDLLAGVEKRKYRVICANIVADIIMRMLPDIAPFMAEDTDLFLSGIISERADEVARCVAACGLKVRERREDNGWTVIRAALR